MLNVKTKPDAIMIREPFSDIEIETIRKLGQISNELMDYFFEREDIIQCMNIAKLSKQHMVFIGPAGIAKSAIIEEYAKYFQDCKIFSALLTKFSTPEELFGPPSIKKLKQDIFERNTKDMIPECEFAFLDEIFNANSSILNALLKLINERIFQGKPAKLENMFAATNFTPEEKALVAFFDRILFRYMVADIHETKNFKKMFLSGKKTPPKFSVSTAEINQLRSRIPEVDATPIMKNIVKIRNSLKKEMIEPSSRRFKWAKWAMQSRAILNKRLYLIEDDLDILKHILWTDKKEIPIVEMAILKAISPISARIQILIQQGVEIEVKSRKLDPEDPDELINIGRTQ